MIRKTQLPELQHYSAITRQRAGQLWPAVNRYLKIIDRSAQNFADELRLYRHRAWLQCALAIFAEEAKPEDVCAFWSEVALEILRRTWQTSGLDDFPITLFALGKLGAGELNLSSDVDLVYIRADHAQIPFKVLRNFQNLVSENTDLGFCLRVDLDLRPGGKSSSIMPSIGEFENHYGYYGETWERLALVRLTPVCGNQEIAQSIQSQAHKFSFRRHLDYTLLEDLKSLRPQIHSSRQTLQSGQFNLKVGVGGIRDIELFFHALQVIHGGKFANLRTQSTTQAAHLLPEGGFLDADTAKFLIETYWSFRDLENRLQARNDQQTYLLAKSDMAALNCQDVYSQILNRAKKVDHVVSTLLGRASERSSSLPRGLEEQDKWLVEMGFSESSRSVWPHLMSATALSRTPQRDEDARLAFLNAFIVELKRIGTDLDLGLQILYEFSRSVRAKASFFTLFLHEPKLISDLAWLFSTSPYLGQILSSRPELLDSFMFRSQSLTTSDDLQIFLDDLADRRLLAELIASSQFLSRRDLIELTSTLSFTADQICTHLLNRMKDDFGGSGVQILTLGKWGGQELGLRSDLDFIFLVDSVPTENDHRVARRFISRINESHKAGAIYPVDLRLRPSGKAGPMLSRTDDFIEYLAVKAEVWERQAYLKARPLENLKTSIPQLACQRGLSDSEREQLKSIRKQLLIDDPQTLDLKFRPGGLVHIEFATQVALLESRQWSADTSTSGMAQRLQQSHARWQVQGSRLIENYMWLRTIEQMQQLTSQISTSQLKVEGDSTTRLARIFGTSQQKLAQEVTQKFEENCALLKELDPLLACR